MRGHRIWCSGLKCSQRALGSSVLPHCLLFCSRQAACTAASLESFLLTQKPSINAFLLASLFLGNFQSIKPQHIHLFWDSTSQSLASFAKPCPLHAANLIVLCCSLPFGCCSSSSLKELHLINHNCSLLKSPWSLLLKLCFCTWSLKCFVMLTPPFREANWDVTSYSPCRSFPVTVPKAFLSLGPAPECGCAVTGLQWQGFAPGFDRVDVWLQNLRSESSHWEKGEPWVRRVCAASRV